MKKVIILGHFALGTNNLNGQTIKTKIITEALQDQLSSREVGIEDTAGGWRFLLRLPLVVLRMLRGAEDIVILPAYKGVRVIVPMLVCLNVFFHRHLHYVVIGGWLPDYTQRLPLLRFFLKHIHHIYVETHSMLQDMERQHFTNVCIMPNCKPLSILSEDQLPPHNLPYKLCTFSRVFKEKGIGEAVDAVKRCNEQFGSTVFELDIYGQIEQKEWFDNLMRNQPSFIAYRGTIPANQSTDVLQNYFALLFPTFYKGEGFAGTLIDAMAAGVPVFASDWHSNAEIVEEGRTGFLFPVHSVDALVKILIKTAEQPDILQQMRVICIRKAYQFLPDVVVQTFLRNLSGQ